jgi:hypothetical protein
MVASVSALWGLGGTPPVIRNKFQRTLPAIAGFSMALCMMCQGKTIIVIPVLMYLAWKWSKTQAFLFTACSFSLPLVWAVRNHFVLGRWNPFNSSSDIVFWMGNNPTTKTGEYVINPPPLPSEFTSYYSAGLDFIINQPERAYSLLLVRMVRLIEPMYFYPDWLSVKGANVALHLLMILLSLTGATLFMSYFMGRLWIRPPSIPSVGPIAVLVILFVLVHIPFATEVRHTKPIVPLALCVAMPTLVYLFRRIRSSKTFVSSDL